MRAIPLITLISLTVSACANISNNGTLSAISKTSIEPEQANEQMLAYADSELRAAARDSASAELISGSYGTRDCHTRDQVEYKVWAGAVRVNENVKGYLGEHAVRKTYLIYFADGKPAALGEVPGEILKYATYQCPDELLQKIQ